MIELVHLSQDCQKHELHFKKHFILEIMTIIPSGPKKTAHGFHCNNFAYSQSIFIILAHVHYRKFATGWCIVSPPNTVCVTTLPCKSLSHNFIHVHFYSLFQKRYPFTFEIIANFLSNFHKHNFWKNCTWRLY